MRVFENIPDDTSVFTNPVLTIGSFDGLHMGHRRILSTLLNIARAKSGDPVVLTFSSHPRKVITPKTPPRILTTKQEKIRAIGNCGINNVIMLDFTKEISEMHADEFFNELILKKIGIIDIVVGYDHAFGKDREGTFEYLKERSRNRGFGVTRVEPKNFYSRPVSSTWIRTELEDGNIILANALLGRCYTLSGTVQKGFGRGGRQLGFPQPISFPTIRTRLCRRMVSTPYMLLLTDQYGGRACSISAPIPHLPTQSALSRSISSILMKTCTGAQ
ncbi:MAG TPA: riboflavin kinase [Spirochaetota bacterium]|mgnify:CR=1 FL=1|nr:riboflavin kinase [Spirochaetota bacterium]